MPKTMLFFIAVFGTLSAKSQSKWNNTGEALQWLNSKIASVMQDDKKYTQNLHMLPENPALCEFLLSTESGGVVSGTSNFFFYPEYMNPNGMTAEISGKSLTLNLTSQNNLKLVKELKNGAYTGYTHKFQVYFDDLQVAREAMEAFKYIGAQLPHANPVFRNKPDAYAWLGKNVSQASFGSTVYANELQIQQDQNDKFVLNITETDSKGSTVKKYEFYLTDFNANLIRVTASNSRIGLTFTTVGELKPIKYYINGQQQNYTNKIELYVDDPQRAFYIKDAFTYLLTAKTPTGDAETPPAGTAASAATPQTISDPFEGLEGKNIATPDYDHVPMWYNFTDQKLAELERAGYAIETRSNGYGTTESLLFFDKITSPVFFPPSTLPLFLVKLSSPSIDPYSVIKLNVATINQNKNRRECITGQNKIARSTIKENTTGIRILKKEPGVYYVRPETTLPVGEYFFSFGEKQVFAFSIK